MGPETIHSRTKNGHWTFLAGGGGDEANMEIPVGVVGGGRDKTK